MDLDEQKILFLIVGGVLVLLTASPFLSRILVLPRTEFFSELWLLGSNHMAEEFPFNVSSGEEYCIFLGIGNHLGSATYYKVAVKFQNQTQSRYDSFNRTPSNLPALCEIRAFLADESIWEVPFTFAFDCEYDEIHSQVEVNRMTLNDVIFEIETCTLVWDWESNGFLGNLLFELWIYESRLGKFQYHERFVNLWLNMTT